MTRAEQIISEYLDEQIKRAAEKAAEACKAADSPEDVKSASAALLRAMDASSALVVAIDEHRAKQEYIDKLVAKAEALEAECDDEQSSAKYYQEEAQRLERELEQANKETLDILNERDDKAAFIDKLLKSAAELEKRLAEAQEEARKWHCHANSFESIANIQAEKISKLENQVEHERNERLRFEEAHHMNLYQYNQEAQAQREQAEKAGEENAAEWTPGKVDKSDLAQLTRLFFIEGWNASNKYHDIRTK